MSSDGGSTLKYVAYDYDLENLNDFSGYEAIGVCVNTEFMIYYEYEWLTYDEAKTEYPQTPDGWTMPTNAQLETIFSNYQILGISARVAGSSDSSLYGKNAWSSERDTNGYPYYYAFAYNSVFANGHGNPSECIVILVRDLEVTPTTYIGAKAPSEAKTVGDIVFSDGSATAYTSELTLTDEQISNAVAVIFYAGSASDTLGAKTLGVGLKNTKGETTTTLQWARYTSSDNKAEGNSTNITAIQCTPSESGSGKAATATFTGDLNGSDNWQALCDAVSDEGTSGNYPAWEWVNAYATENSLAGSYANGWYLPTVAELCMLYREKDTVNSALEKTGGTKIADEGYWSSSQDASDNSLAWVVRFGSGYFGINTKDVDGSVCAVRAF